MSAITTAVVFLTANALWAFEQPDRGSSAEELVRFYEDLSIRDELFGNVAFGGALLGLAAGIGAESINMAAALRAADGELTEPLALALFDISHVLGYNAAGIGIGLLALSAGAVALRTRALLPRWLAIVTLILGAALLTPLSLYALAPSFVLLLALGVMLLRGSGMRPGHSPG